ncbi:MFS transporter [Solimonas sp. K1W22B-7]|uniref:MFS transporter n=1 Tax=Solimonas sp. K1W22B-7 TaxID=2303331 RepID=UPI0013C3E897|nr:MFS transporter [Solimonas sp. K1W22B-7]
MSAESTHNRVLGRGLLFAFALPAIMQGFTHAPEAMVQGIYAKHAGVSLEALATALLLTRLFDGLTYPLIGYLSDRTARRTGSRKPWIVVGTVVTVTGLWFLYRPPQAVTSGWFLCWFMVTYLGWKLTEIPYSAWSVALSSDYVQRSRIQVWRGLAMLIGSFVFYLVPYMAKALGLSDTTELNLQNMALVGVVVLVLVPAMNLYSLWCVPDGELPPPPPVAAAESWRNSWRVVWHAVARNKPMIHFLAAFVPATFLAGMATGASYLLIDSYLGLGKQLPGIMLVAIPLSVISVPFWGWLGTRYERHHTWSVALGAMSLSYACLALLPRGEAGHTPLIVIYAAVVFCLTSIMVIAPAMVGDIADHGRLQSGEDRAGIYIAIIAFVTKSLGGVAAALALALVGWFGFDAKATEQTASGTFGIKLVSIYLPALGLGIASLLIWGFPITRRQQEATAAALRERDARNAAAATATAQGTTTGTTAGNS